MKRITKIILIEIFTLFLCCLFSTVTFAEDTIFETVGATALLDSLPSETTELLEILGIDSFEFDSIFDVEFKDFLSLAKKLLTGAIESPVKSALRLLIIIVIIAIFEAFLQDDNNYRMTVEVVASLLCILSILEPVSTAITSAVSSISVAQSFMLALIPILTVIVSVSGNPTLAISFQSVAFFAAEVISVIAKSVLVPVVGAVLALDITASLIPMFKLSGLTDFMKKTLTATLSLIATVFMSFLGIKGALANAADTVAGKGIKMIISSAVPVVGGALSEAYSGIMGSIVIARSTVGIIGICIISLITLPSIVQLLFWIFTLRLTSSVAELFEQKSIAVFFRAIASSLVLLNVVLLFVAVLFILSTALLIAIRAG